VLVEVNTGEAGAPDLILVGLPDAAVKESEDRVSSALSNSGFHMPRTRTTINLAPGDLRKEGSIYDLPIALGVLQATGQLTVDNLGDYLVAGEFSLSGATRPLRGALAMALLARDLGKRGLLIPPHSAAEAALVEGLAVYPVRSLDEAFRFFTGEASLTPQPGGLAAYRAGPGPSGEAGGDFSEVKGQHALRRAVEVAVAGPHNLLILCAITPSGSTHATMQSEDKVLAWQRSNPVATEWFCEFGRVFEEPERCIDSINLPYKRRYGGCISTAPRTATAIHAPSRPASPS
jgi:magnesium chelatase family protein